MTTTLIRSEDLEPSLVFGQTYVTRRRSMYIDAATLLGVMVALLSLIPAPLILPGMTDLGRPGLLVGFVLFAWWMLSKFSQSLAMPGPQPIRWGVLVFMLSLLVSYAIGFMRGLTSMEVNAADRTLMYFCVFCGVALTAADGLHNWLRLRAVLKVLVVCAAIVAVIALIEYVLRQDITLYMTIPGLQAKGWIPAFMARGDGVRVAATTSHYIELAAYLALVVPFAIHFAYFSQRPARRRLARLSTLLLLAGIAATISRTGILAVVLTIFILVPVWTWRMRYNALAMCVTLVAGFSVASPKLARTLVDIFSGASNDTSVTARTSRYGMVFHYVAQHPWLGRGTGTWVPPQYQILDNQWLGTLLNTGIVGVAVLLGLHVTGITLAAKAWRRSTTPEDRHLCAALVCTQVMAIADAGTFDSLSFLTYATTLALTLGMCGTVWRLTHPARTVRTSTIRWYL